MMSYAISILLAAAGPTDQAAARDTPASPWKSVDDRVALPNAKISFPTKAGTLALTSATELSHKGQGIDNGAKYESSDRALIATAYVYLPAFPDTALTAYETDRVVAVRFGPKMATIERSVVDAPGHPGTVIRMTYDGGAASDINKGEPAATASAFVRVGGWIVKLRVSGPSARRDEVFAGLDALIAGLRFEPGTQVFPATPLQIAAPCPADGRPAILVPPDKRLGTALLEVAILSVSANLEDASGKAGKIAPQFPKNGRDAVCVRGSSRIGSHDVQIFQPTGIATPPIVLGVLGDSGSMFVIQKTAVGGGYILKTTAIGEALLYGEYDSIPTGEQIEALFGGKTKEGASPRGSVTLTAKGDSKINLPERLVK